MNDDQLRIGDAERERATAELGDHYAEGRLSTEEHAERLDRIWAARTRGELGTVFADLPGGAATSASPAAPVRPGGRALYGRRGGPSPLLLVLAVLVVVSVATHLPFFLAGLLALLLLARHRRRA